MILAQIVKDGTRECKERVEEEGRGGERREEEVRGERREERKEGRVTSSCDHSSSWEEAEGSVCKDWMGFPTTFPL